MKSTYYSIIAILMLSAFTASAKLKDTVQLKEVHIKGVKTITGMGHLDEVHDNIIYSGQKNEVLIADSLDANLAQDNPRQVLGRVPGSNYSETEGNGFPSNGIGFRGLNPTQSIETNTRQNGYNIAGDIYGYPESYYLTPLEAIERIEVVRGASALQFGPQFGGVVNYITKSAPADKKFEDDLDVTTGSYGLYDVFNSLGGTINKWSYFGFIKAEYAEGQRANSEAKEITGFGRVEYKASVKFKVGLEYSLLRNMLHMPGGLSDAQFNADPQQSYRSRNWLITPWNIMALTAEWKATEHTTITLKSAQNISSRTLVWRNEDGGPETLDTIVPGTNTFINREVEHEYFNSNTTEIRSLTQYEIGNREQSLAAGIRLFDGWMKRQEGGLGSTGTNADFTNYADYNEYEKDLDFRTYNFAPFVENTFHVGEHLSITPGARFEYIGTSATGHVTDTSGAILNINSSKSRYIFLGGIALQYATSRTTNIYGNITQAYTPISYSFLYPMGLNINTRIDPNLKDVNGYNADLGFRGRIKRYLTFDVSAFYMAHRNNIAIETGFSNGMTTYYETNVGDAIHKGVECYAELDLVKMLMQGKHAGSFSFFNSLAWDNAKYVNGIYAGNTAEYAPALIDRFGMTGKYKRLSATLLFSHTSKQFSDANNTVFDPNAGSGVIPAYSIIDLAATYKMKALTLKFGVNNLANTNYFTFRTTEYPGPGIIPSMGRSMYFGVGMNF